MYTKENLLVAKFASKNSIKSELRCIAYFGDKTVATDSFRLLEVPTPTDEDGTEPVAFTVPQLREANSAKMPAGTIAVSDPLGYDDKLDGSVYPKYEQIMPKYDDDDVITIKFDAKLLGEMLMQMAKLSKRKHVTIKVPKNQGRPILIEADYRGKTARGIVMPLNQ